MSTHGEATAFVFVLDYLLNLCVESNEPSEIGCHYFTVSLHFSKAKKFEH